MFVHLDGARIANAAAALDVPLRAFTSDLGVDVVSFGGTKNGIILGECVVVLHPDAVRGMAFLRKLSMQLSSKMRFVSVQFDALLSGDLWHRNASHSDAMAWSGRIDAYLGRLHGGPQLLAHSQAQVGNGSGGDFCGKGERACKVHPGRLADELDVADGDRPGVTR